MRNLKSIQAHTVQVCGLILALLLSGCVQVEKAEPFALERIKIEPKQRETLLKKVKPPRNPQEIDKLTKQLGAPSYLLNVYFASTDDLSDIGLGPVVDIPVQISKREGGTKSVFLLKPGEKILKSILASDRGLALKFIKRETGSAIPAKVGDLYSEEITNLQGELVVRMAGQLKAFDPNLGSGEIHFEDKKPSEGPTPKYSRKVWVIKSTWWSFSSEARHEWAK